jgi:hypothetical protein
MKKWRAYERLVAKLVTDEYDSSYTVIPNAHVTGFISRRKRQIDILIDFRYNSDLSRRIIIDAKNRKKPIDINDVEAFEGMMRDVRAKHGYLYCSNGSTRAAERRAQDTIGIRLLTEDNLENLNLYSWDPCLSYDCLNGLVLWDANPSFSNSGLLHIHSIGKCDECGLFHIWCWDCGRRAAMQVEDEWRCGCDVPWFWLTSIESEEKNGGYQTQSNYLMVVDLTGNYQIVDRRPL